MVEFDDECDERDYCVPEDESATAKGDYVSLVDNAERFTGYAGATVWDAIYRENCFSKAPASSSSLSSVSSPFGGFQAANDLRHVIQAGSSTNELDFDDSCLEKRVFYRIISGMHASINTHICNDYLNQTTGTWGPNLACYTSRLATHPERISNLYFNYALLLRAVSKLRTSLKSYTFCSGDTILDGITKNRILALASTASITQPKIFDESIMFQGPEGGLKEDFRNRFRNVSRLMDCVGCDKCRLWGKLQTVGYGTALKILFEFDEEKNGENPPLRRTELVALVNTLDRVSHSLEALGRMRDPVLQQRQPQQQSQPAAAPATPQKSKKDVPSSKKQEGARMTWTDMREFRDPTPSLDDLDDDDADPYGNDEKPGQEEEEESILEAIRSEARTVWKAYVYVLRSWIGFPAMVARIAGSEMGRLWRFSWGWRLGTGVGRLGCRDGRSFRYG